MSFSDLPIDVLGTIAGFSGSKAMERVNRQSRQAAKGITASKVRRQACIDKIKEYCPHIFLTREELIKSYVDPITDDSSVKDVSDNTKYYYAFKDASKGYERLLRDTLGQSNTGPFLMLLTVGDDSFKRQVVSEALKIAVKNKDVEFFISTISAIAIDTEGLLDEPIDMSNINIDVEYLTDDYSKRKTTTLANLMTTVSSTRTSIKWLEKFKKKLESFSSEPLKRRVELFMILITHINNVALSNTIIDECTKIDVKLPYNDNRAVTLCQHWISFCATGTYGRYVLISKKNLSKNLTISIVVSLIKNHGVDAKTMFNIMDKKFYGNAITESLWEAQYSVRDMSAFLEICREFGIQTKLFLEGIITNAHNNHKNSSLWMEFLNDCVDITDREEFLYKALESMKKQNIMEWLTEMMKDLTKPNNNSYCRAFFEALIAEIYADIATNFHALSGVKRVDLASQTAIHTSITSLLQQVDKKIGK